MSSPIVAEIGVRIRPDFDTFKAEAEAQAEAAVRDIQPQVRPGGARPGESFRSEILAAQAERAAKEAAEAGAKAAAKAAQDAANQASDAFIAKVEDLQLRAATAALRGSDIEAEQLSVMAAIESVTFAAQEARRELAGAVRADQGTLRDFLRAQIDEYERARVQLEQSLARSQQTGQRPQLGEQRGGVLGQLGDFARASGRTGGLGGLVATTARLGLIGAAATTAFIAVQELREGLRVTGDEAFTAEGKLRNLGSELLGGNIIGGIRALTATRQAEIGSSIVARVKELKEANDPLVVTEEKLLAIRTRGADALNVYLAALRVQGAISEDTADDLRKVADELFNQERAARAAAAAVDEVTRAMARSGSEAARFGERGGDFGRGVGAIAAQQAAAGAQGLSTTDPTATSGVSAAIRQSIAQRTETLDDDLREARREVDEIRTRNENLRAVTDGRAQRYRELVEAQTRAKDLERQIADQARAADEAAAQASAATAASVASRTETLDDDIRAARAEEARIRQRNATMANIAKNREQRNRELAEAETRVVQLEKQRAADQERVANEAQQATQQALQNDISRAVISGNRDRIRSTFDAAIDYFRELVRGAEGLEREQFEARLIALRTQRREALQGDTSAAEIREAELQNRVAQARLQSIDVTPILRAQVRLFQNLVNQSEGLERIQNEAKLIAAKGAVRAERGAIADLRLENARARAALTEGIEDDRRTILKQIERARKLVAQSRGLAREQARARLIQFEGDLAGLDRRRDSGQAQSALDILGISRQIFRDFAGNLQPTGAFARTQEQVEATFPRTGALPGATAAAAEPTLEELRRIRRLLEDGAGAPQVDLDVNQTFTQPSVDTSFAQAKWARFALEEAFNS